VVRCVCGEVCVWCVIVGMSWISSEDIYVAVHAHNQFLVALVLNHSPCIMARQSKSILELHKHKDSLHNYLWQFLMSGVLTLIWCTVYETLVLRICPHW